MNVVVGEAAAAESNLMVQPGPAMGGATLTRADADRPLTAEDAEEIGRHCPAVTDAAPIVHVASQIVEADGVRVPTNVYGTRRRWPPCAIGRPPAEGAMFGDRNVRQSNAVCVIGREFAAEFIFQPAVGKRVRIEQRLISDHRRVTSRVREGERRGQRPGRMARGPR